METNDRSIPVSKHRTGESLVVLTASHVRYHAPSYHGGGSTRSGANERIPPDGIVISECSPNSWWLPFGPSRGTDEFDDEYQGEVTEFGGESQPPRCGTGSRSNGFLGRRHLINPPRAVK